MKYIPISVAIVLVAGFTSSSQAATVLSAIDATASTSRGNILNTINQNGLLFGSEYTSGVTDFDDYISSDPMHTSSAAGNEWFSDFGNTTATVTFDLGDIFTIDRVALWAEEASGFGTAELLASIDGINFNFLGTINPFDNPGVPNMFSPYGPEVFGFGATEMRYFRMNLSGCPQPDPGSTDECSLGEIAFSSVAPVPLPASGLLFVAGLAALGGLRRNGTSN